jgi:hypothetical protein
MNTETSNEPTAATPAPAKETLSDATKLLFWLVINSRLLSRQFGIELSADGKKLNCTKVPRPWLTKRPGGNELNFDPDLYAKTLEFKSHGERLMGFFILNIWSPSGAKQKGWTFDIFEAARVLDAENLEAIATILQAPSWP